MQDFDLETFLPVIPIAATIIAYLFLAKYWTIFIRPAKITKHSATVLLRTGFFDEWNEFRALNLDWKPVLRKMALTGKELLDTNFRYAVLADILFKDSNLQCADFRDARLERVDFSNANLLGARFDRATFTDVVWGDAQIDESLFKILRQLQSGVTRDQIRLVSLRTITELHKAEISSLTAPEFDEFVRALLEKAGYTLEKTPDQLGLTACDFIARRKHGSADEVVVVQTFHYDTRREVGGSRIRRLSREREKIRAHRALLIGNGRLAPDATRVANATQVHFVGAEQLQLAAEGEYEILKPL